MLFEYCKNYVDSANEKTDEKIYELCFYYLLDRETEKQREILIKFFNL